MADSLMASHSKLFFKRALEFLLWLGVAMALTGLLSRVWYEVASGVLHGDALIFQTVGRGILNGKVPYRDLFETKPPGIFLLHALSWKIFGSQIFVKITQALALLSIPLFTLLPILPVIENRATQERRLISALTILFGILLALYTADQAGEGLTESYGAALSLAFLAIAAVPGTVSRKRSFFLGILLLCTAGIREPLVLVILSGLLLLHKKDRGTLASFHLRAFAIPFVIAAVIGFAALAALGYAGPFFTVYLPHMVFFHINQNDMPMILRALEVRRLFLNMTVYSLFFAVAVSCLWIVVLVAGIRSEGKQFVLRFVGASLLTFLAVAIGGDFYGHHFIFAVPFYAALWWVVVRYGVFSAHSVVAALFGALFICAAVFDTQISYADEARAWKKKEAELRHAAAVMDTVMDRCGYERGVQFVMPGGGPYAFAKRSPDGPIFVHYTRFIGRTDAYQKAHVRSLNEVPLILMDDPDKAGLTSYAKRFLQTYFTEEQPPSCVGSDFRQPLPYHLLLRKK